MVQSSEKLQVPTLLIWAAGDTALGPQLAAQTPQFVENLQLHVLEDCSHWAQQDRYMLVGLDSVAEATYTMLDCVVNVGPRC